MKLWSNLLFAGSMCIFGQAFAAPVYLECDLTNDEGGKSNAQITIDEDTRKITHTDFIGRAFNTEGFFTSNTVSYQKSEINDVSRTVNSYDIDRTTLEYEHNFRMDAADEEIRVSSPDLVVEYTIRGVCAVASTEGRKI